MNTQDIADRKAFVDAFITCAAWQATDDDGDSLDEYDFAPGAIVTMVEWCHEFMDAHSAALEKYDAPEAGHCFALSANGHGAGFCDYVGDKVRGSNARTLMDASKKYAYNIWLDSNNNLCIE